jgi:hypothetical protein
MSTLTSAALTCRGQLIEIDPGEYDWLVLDLTSDRAVDETVWLHYRGGADPEFLRGRAGTGTCRIPVPRHDVLVALRLPDRPDVLVHAITPVGVSIGD